MRYKVIPLKDNAYQVIDTHEEHKVKHQGTLSECDAWIRLTEEGYL